MLKFENVTITANVNVYFDGNVTSRSVEFSDGSIKTLGVMLPGEYEFGTDAPELMEILSGELQVILPETDEPILINGGEEFHVPGNSKFVVKVAKVTDYVCTYLS